MNYSTLFIQRGKPGNILILVCIILLFQSELKAQSLKSDLVFISQNAQISQQPFYSHVQVSESIFSPGMEENIARGIAFNSVIGITKQGRDVEAYFFPGKSNQRALIIGGVHGSEQSSIEFAWKVIKLLSTGELPHFSVLIIPCLFPDNAALAIEKNCMGHSGRYSSEHAPDPNRQMPPPGQAFDPYNPVDIYGREIETENKYLLNLIQQFKPERIASLHAIKDVSKAGFFADPRTDANGIALGFEPDSLIAASMTSLVCEKGGSVSSSWPDSIKVVYHLDPQPVPAGNFQPRNFRGSKLINNRGNGISLGSWATTAVCHEDPSITRKAITLITIEFPGYRSSLNLEPGQEFNYFLNLDLYSKAVLKYFLH